MGQNKMLLELHGEPLVRRVVQSTYEAGCDPIVVVTGPDEGLFRAALSGLPVETVENPDSKTPPGRSFQIGLTRVTTADAAILCLGDMVAVTPAMLTHLIDTAIAGARVVLSEFGSVVAPPFLVTADLFPQVQALEPDRVVQQLGLGYATDAATVSWPREKLVDVDTPEDWASLQEGSD